MTPYRELIQRLRLCFPQPVSDRMHDSYLVHTFLRALDEVDALKSELPILGVKEPLDYQRARCRKLEDSTHSVEEVTSELVSYLSGTSLWGHPRAQQNVVPPPSLPSLVGLLLAGLANPNMGWDEYSHRLAEAEVEASAIAADLVGYDPTRSAGVFTFGGTGATLYAMKVGLEKALPGSMEAGVREDALIFASDASHYCRYSVAGWLGLGARNVVTIPTGPDNSIDIVRLRQVARQAAQQGRKIAGLVATMGTTDAFGIDDLEAVLDLRDELVEEFRLDYRPHVHADAVIGWAWASFLPYDFEANPMGFRPRTVRALAAASQRMRPLQRADSVGVDFHKTGYAPYVSTLVLFRDQADLGRLARDRARMPYLYQFGEYRPGMYTLETSRAATGVLAALANLRLLGRQGLQALIGHAVEMAQTLREHLEGHATLTVLNRENVGPVTLFRVYPPEVDTFRYPQREFSDPNCQAELELHNDYNRRIYQHLHEEAMSGRGVLLSLTECYRQTSYGAPIVALKSYILSPFVEEQQAQEVVAKVLEAQKVVTAGVAG